MNKIERPENLKEQIYILCLKRPRYGNEIAELIYKPVYGDKWIEHKSTVSTTVNKMKSEKWLSIDKRPNKELEKKMAKISKKSKTPIDKRSVALRQYLKSKPEPIIKQFPSNLSKDDKKALENIIQSEEFKTIVSEEITTLELLTLNISALTLAGIMTINNQKADKEQLENMLKIVYKAQENNKMFSIEQLRNITTITQRLNNELSDEGKRNIVESNELLQAVFIPSTIPLNIALNTFKEVYKK